MWAKYFSHRDPGLPTVTIPAEWLDFFTMMLLKDSSNEWATHNSFSLKLGPISPTLLMVIAILFLFQNPSLQSLFLNYVALTMQRSKLVLLTLFRQ
jgi:hypothetical protein